MDQTVQQRTKTADEKFCSECGQIIKVKAEICPSCGVRQLPAPNLTQEKTKFFKGNLVEKLLYFRRDFHSVVCCCKFNSQS